MNVELIKRSLAGREGTLSTLTKKMARIVRNRTGTNEAFTTLAKQAAILIQRNLCDRLVIDLTEEDRSGPALVNVGAHEVVDLMTFEGIEFLQCRGCKRSSKSKHEMETLFCTQKPTVEWNGGILKSDEYRKKVAQARKDRTREIFALRIKLGEYEAQPNSELVAAEIRKRIEILEERNVLGTLYVHRFSLRDSHAPVVSKGVTIEDHGGTASPLWEG